MKQTQIAFTRHERGCLNTLMVVEITHNDTLSNPKEVMAAFKRGVTAWVEETPEGKAEWDYSSNDLNIGDLCSHQDDPGLDNCLGKEDIRDWEVLFQLSVENEIPYDTVLASPERLDETESWDPEDAGENEDESGDEDGGNHP